MNNLLPSIILLVSTLGTSECSTSQVHTANVDVNASSPVIKAADDLISDEEYNIYSEIINKDKISSGANILIIEKTTPGEVMPGSTLDEIIVSVKKNLPPSVPREVFEDFRQKNSETGTLTAKFVIKNSYRLIGRDRAGQDQGVLLAFSRVGFNQEKNVALLYYESHGGPKTGSGEYLVLRKKDGKWAEESRYTSWIS